MDEIKLLNLGEDEEIFYRTENSHTIAYLVKLKLFSKYRIYKISKEHGQCIHMRDYATAEEMLKILLDSTFAE